MCSTKKERHENMKIIENFVFLLNTFLLISGNLHDSYSKLRFGYRLDRKMIDSYTEYSILDCVEECLRTTRCKSVSYYKGANYCEISYENKTTAPDKHKEDKGWIYSEREDWDQKITGSCSEAKCQDNEKCISQSLGNYTCILSDCGMPPVVYGADSNSLERWDAIGVYRQIHLQCHKYIFKKKGSGMLGCSTNGTWTINLSCEFQEVWVPFEGKLYMIKSKTGTWEVAKKDCESLGQGSTLAEIESEKENNWITENLLTPYFAKGVHWLTSVFWIGGKCEDGNPTTCVWKGSIKIFPYHNWRTDEPSGDGKCVIIVKDGGIYNGKWNDFSCSEAKSYLCEKAF